MTPSNLLREIADAMERRGDDWWRDFERAMGDCVPIPYRSGVQACRDVTEIIWGRDVIRIRRIPRPEVWPG